MLLDHVRVLNGAPHAMVSWQQIRGVDDIPEMVTNSINNHFSKFDPIEVAINLTLCLSLTQEE